MESGLFILPAVRPSMSHLTLLVLFIKWRLKVVYHSAWLSENTSKYNPFGFFLFKLHFDQGRKQLVGQSLETSITYTEIHTVLCWVMIKEVNKT